VVRPCCMASLRCPVQAVREPGVRWNFCLDQASLRYLVVRDRHVVALSAMIVPFPNTRRRCRPNSARRARGPVRPVVPSRDAWQVFWSQAVRSMERDVAEG